jgi:hypothetical protein
MNNLAKEFVADRQSQMPNIGFMYDFSPVVMLTKREYQSLSIFAIRVSF